MATAGERVRAIRIEVVGKAPAKQPLSAHYRSILSMIDRGECFYNGQDWRTRSGRPVSQPGMALLRERGLIAISGGSQRKVTVAPAGRRELGASRTGARS